MIGVFDSGVGGLTVLRNIHTTLPEYSTIYLGDSANAPYGEKTHEEITELTWKGVRWLFDQGCYLVILACNSASAQALREIQMTKLGVYPGRRVLGVIIPTAESLSEKGYKDVLVLGTKATIGSGAYEREFGKCDSSIRVHGHACPRWVPLIEAGRAGSREAKDVVREDVSEAVDQYPDIDAILLGCTHYPVVADSIRSAVPEGVPVYVQGVIVAEKLADYLKRHPEMDKVLQKRRDRRFFTTGDVEIVERLAEVIGGEKVRFEKVIDL